MNACFFCTTPYQIIASAAITRNLQREAVDLYIVAQFNINEDLVEKLYGLHLFRNIKVIEEKEFRIKHFGKYKISHFDAIKGYFNVEKLANELFIPGLKYDEIYVSSAKSFTARWAYLYYYKKKTPFELFYFDDGCGSYYDYSTCYRLNNYDRIIRKIMFGEQSSRTDNILYLYSPELFYRINNNWHLKEIKKINTDNIDEIINKIFTFKNEDTIYEDIILLDTIRDNNKSEKEMMIDQCYDLTLNLFGCDNVIIKRHPRDNSGMKESLHYYENITLPIEAICVNMNLDTKCLVSVDSSSAIMPKLMFNQEPYVILLYRIVYNSLNSKLDLLFSSIQSEYKTKRFFIPENIQELENTIRYVQKQLDRF